MYTQLLILCIVTRRPLPLHPVVLAVAAADPARPTRRRRRLRAQRRRKKKMTPNKLEIAAPTT